MYTFNRFRQTLMVFYRRAREMHTDGLLGVCEYRRSLWVTNMSLSDATAAYRRAGLAVGMANSAAISPPFDRWRHTNRSAYSMDDFYRTRRRLWRDNSVKHPYNMPERVW